jgi:iron-sulfur cluster assembly protein
MTMPIKLSPAAVERVRRFTSGRPDAVGMRLGVKRTGCSGWGYQVDVAERVGDDDSVFEQDGVKVVVDAQSLQMIDGTEVDFVRRGLNEEFVFRNPNAAGECGCGESFTIQAA